MDRTPRTPETLRSYAPLVRKPVNLSAFARIIGVSITGVTVVDIDLRLRKMYKILRSLPPVFGDNGHCRLLFPYLQTFKANRRKVLRIGIVECFRRPSAASIRSRDFNLL